MDDAATLVAAAEQLGYRAEAARAALAWAAGELAARGLGRRRFYIFRGRGGDADRAGGGGASGRPRLLLAFPSADDALGFAQRQGLGASPRLLPLSLAQILAALAQRPAIGAALFADGSATARGLPGGLRVERDALLTRLAAGPGELFSADDGEKLV